MLLSKSAVCDSKKSKFTEEQEASGLLSRLGTKILLSKFLWNVLFHFNSINQNNTRYKMNEIVIKYLLAGDKFMIHLPKQTR